MTQQPDSMKSKCPKCGADRGEPCTTNSGREAKRTHYGRPHWSAQVKRKVWKNAYEEYERARRDAYVADLAREQERRRYGD